MACYQEPGLIPREWDLRKGKRRRDKGTQGPASALGGCLVCAVMGQM